MDITRTGPTGALLLLLVLALTGCGDEVAAGGSDPGVRVPRDAVGALACEGGVHRSGAGDYADGGLERVRDDPDAAVRDLVDQNLLGLLPPDGYSVTGRAESRALVTYDVAGAAKIAFVVEDDRSDWDGNRGWGVTSWALCDPSELPRDVAEELGVGVWTDARGRRVPVTDVRSSDGPEHCDWQDIVFLHVGAGKDAQQYLRDTRGELAELTRGRYAEGVDLPDSAEPTGWRRAGRELWLVPDAVAAYLVAVGDRGDVERWPGADGVACM